MAYSTHPSQLYPPGVDVAEDLLTGDVRMIVTYGTHRMLITIPGDFVRQEPDRRKYMNELASTARWQLQKRQEAIERVTKRLKE